VKPVREAESQTMAAEAYRALRTNLSYVSPARPPRVIVVTSALSGDGKTTSASNLAVTLAQQNKRVLLIDAETRRGNMHTLFGIPANPGFFDLLYGQATAGECIRRVTLEGAAISTCCRAAACRATTRPTCSWRAGWRRSSSVCARSTTTC
jgi:Mrp family chromosome partitioning ATPase